MLPKRETQQGPRRLIEQQDHAVVKRTISSFRCEFKTRNTYYAVTLL